MTAPLIPGPMLRERAERRPDSVIFRLVTDDATAPREVTYAELYSRASAIATRLVALDLHQRPVLLIYKPGPAFTEAFFGTLLAGVIAVPVPVPQFAAQYERLERVAIDCEPGAVLTTSALAASLAARFDAGAHLTACHWLATDALDPADPIDLPDVSRDSVALLQYTSGSTAEPRGVVVTHDNLAHNATTIIRDLPVPDGGTMCWLPHFHDMGLVGGIVVPVYRDHPCTQMSPLAFLQRPMRWLEAGGVMGTMRIPSGTPNKCNQACAMIVDHRWVATCA